MTTGALLIARLGSTRLPQKNILPIVGKPMIQLLAERVQAARSIDRVIITTSTLHSDDPLEELAAQVGLDCYRGPLENIMERIVGAARYYDCDTIVEILGDNPLVHANLIDDVCDLYRSGRYDYAANITREYDPHTAGKQLFSLGMRVQVYAMAAALAYTDYPAYPDNGKHPCAYIFYHPRRFKVGYLEATGHWAFMNSPDWNFAVNYQKNFDLVTRIFQENYLGDKNFSIGKIYHQMVKNPELVEMLGAE